MEELKKKQYVFTTDSEDPKTKVNDIIKALKERNSSANYLNSLLDVSNSSLTSGIIIDNL